MNALQRAKKTLSDGGHTCVVAKDGAVYTSNERGIRPILTWLRQDSDFLRGADVADKVIGKAAALLFCHGGVREVYAGVVSRPSLQVFEAAGISVSYGTLVENIRNREGTGMCPMEQRALTVETPQEAFAVFSEIVK